LLLGFGLFHSPALFRRGPWRIQRFDDLFAEPLDLFSYVGRIIEMTQGTPIDILTARDDRKNRVIAPFALVF
jgi:hypothetical protein